MTSTMDCQAGGGSVVVFLRRLIGLDATRAVMIEGLSHAEAIPGPW